MGKPKTLNQNRKKKEVKTIIIIQGAYWTQLNIKNICVLGVCEGRQEIEEPFEEIMIENFLTW